MHARHFYAAVLLTCVAVSAFARTPDRTGFYIGPNAGLAFNKLSMNNLYNVQFSQISGVFVPTRGIVIVPGTTRPAPVGTSANTGITGGIQLGYRKQFNQWFAGIEGDINFLSSKVQADVDDSLPPTLLQWNAPWGVHHTAEVHMTESIRAKFGYVLRSGMGYATAGVAFASLKTTAADYYNTTAYWAQPWQDNVAHPTPAQVRFAPTANNKSVKYGLTGFIFGIGYDWFLAPAYSLGIEYRHAAFSKSYVTGDSNVDTVRTDARPAYSGVIAGIPEDASFKSGQLSFRLNISLGPAQKLKKGKSVEKGDKR